MATQALFSVGGLQRLAARMRGQGSPQHVPGLEPGSPGAQARPGSAPPSRQSPMQPAARPSIESNTARASALARSGASPAASVGSSGRPDGPAAAQCRELRASGGSPEANTLEGPGREAAAAARAASPGAAPAAVPKQAQKPPGVREASGVVRVAGATPASGAPPRAGPPSPGVAPPMAGSARVSCSGSSGASRASPSPVGLAGYPGPRPTSAPAPATPPQAGGSAASAPTPKPSAGGLWPGVAGQAAQGDIDRAHLLAPHASPDAEITVQARAGGQEGAPLLEAHAWGVGGGHHIARPVGEASARSASGTAQPEAAGDLLHWEEGGGAAQGGAACASGTCAAALPGSMAADGLAALLLDAEEPATAISALAAEGPAHGHSASLMDAEVRAAAERGPGAGAGEPPAAEAATEGAQGGARSPSHADQVQGPEACTEHDEERGYEPPLLDLSTPAAQGRLPGLERGCAGGDTGRPADASGAAALDISVLARLESIALADADAQAGGVDLGAGFWPAPPHDSGRDMAHEGMGWLLPSAVDLGAAPSSSDAQAGAPGDPVSGFGSPLAGTVAGAAAAEPHGAGSRDDDASTGAADASGLPRAEAGSPQPLRRQAPQDRALGAGAGPELPADVGPLLRPVASAMSLPDGTLTHEAARVGLPEGTDVQGAAASVDEEPATPAPAAQPCCVSMPSGKPDLAAAGGRGTSPGSDEELATPAAAAQPVMVLGTGAQAITITRKGGRRASRCAASPGPSPEHQPFRAMLCMHACRLEERVMHAAMPAPAAHVAKALGTGANPAPCFSVRAIACHCLLASPVLAGTSLICLSWHASSKEVLEGLGLV